MANPTEATATATAEDHAAMGHTTDPVAAEKAVISGTTVDGAPVAETHASTEAHGGDEAHATPRDWLLGFDGSMWVALAMLVVIVFAIWKKVPAMIGGALDKQIADIRAQLDQATALRTEAEEIKKEYQAKARAAARDAESMKAAAEEEAKLIVAQAKTDATALIARRTKAAEEKIEAAERAAVADVRATAANAAAAAAAQLISAHHDAKADKDLVDGTVASLN